MRCFLSCVFLLAFGLAAQPAHADDPAQSPDAAKPKVKAGDKAPDFELPKPDAPEGSKEKVKLSDLKGKRNVLLAFYPKAFTGGCTKQMCGYRDDIAQFKSADALVIAISTDEQAKSDEFKKSHQMPFVVMGDPEHKVIDAYGIPLRDMNGQQYAQRAVVLIDKEGIIRWIDMEYDIEKDKQPLYKAIADLASKEGAPPASKS